MNKITSGTEKQIAYAEAVRERALSEIAAALADATSDEMKSAIFAYEEQADRANFNRPDAEEMPRAERRAARLAWVTAALTDAAEALRNTADAKFVLDTYVSKKIAPAAVIDGWFYETFVVAPARAKLAAG